MNANKNIGTTIVPHFIIGIYRTMPPLNGQQIQ